MSLIPNIKKSLALTAVLFLFTACGGGGGSESASGSSTNGTQLETSSETSPTSSTTTSAELPKVVELQTNELIITENSVTIEWLDNDYTIEIIEYGTSEKYGSELLLQTEGTVNYKPSSSEPVVTLSDLEADTTYNYRIIGKDKDGKKVVGKNKTFTTSTSEPIVTEPTPEPIITEPTPEPVVAEPTPEPIITEPTPEPVVTEPTPEPIVTEPTPEPIVTEPTPEPEVSSCKSGSAQQLGQIKDSISGNVLTDVTVTIAGCSTKTDANGFYTLNNIVVNDEAVVNFEKEGYHLGSTNIQVKELSGDNTASPNYLEYNMYTYDYQWNHESSKAFSGGAIAINASYIDTKGTPYNGTISAKLTVLNNNEEALLKTFPGAFKGINSNGTLVQFETYGLITILMNDNNGNPLNFSDGKTGTLIFKEVSSQETPETLPLWYYDYDQGLWFEEGFAELQEDGTYRGDISHLGTWSLNRPLEEDTGIYRGRIINEDGSPISDVRLQAIGDNWISSDLSTDEDGVFEIEVIPGKSFKLSAYNYQDKYKASYNNTIAAIASGDIVED